MIAPFANALVKNRKEVDNFDKRNRINKVEAFVKKGCKLTLDLEIKEKAANILNLFTQGLGDNEKPSFVNLTAEFITKKKWSVALLNAQSEINKEASKHILTINKEKLWDDLSRLLFHSPEQSTIFPIIPSDLNHSKETLYAPNTFNGWNTLIKFPLAPLSDAIIIDPYFLKPEAFKDDYGNYDVQDYVECSLIPLMKLLSNYALNKQLTVNIFTEYRENYETIADELFRRLSKSIFDNNLNIELSIVIPEFLSLHKRVLYTNYFSIRTELSFWHFQTDKVTGKKKDEVSIKPYAVDNLNTDPHSIMLADLADLHSLLVNKKTNVYGSKKHLSKMIQQAFSKLNQPPID